MKRGVMSRKLAQRYNWKRVLQGTNRVVQAFTSPGHSAGNRRHVPIRRSVRCAFGFKTAQIKSEDDIEPILFVAIANTGANFIEVMVPSQDKIIPFVASWVRIARAKNLPHFY